MNGNKLLSKALMFATSLVFMTSCTNSDFGSSSGDAMEEHYEPVSGLWIGTQTSLEYGEKSEAVVISADDG